MTLFERLKSFFKKFMDRIFKTQKRTEKEEQEEGKKVRHTFLFETGVVVVYLDDDLNSKKGRIILGLIFYLEMFLRVLLNFLLFLFFDVCLPYVLNVLTFLPYVVILFLALIFFYSRKKR